MEICVSNKIVSVETHIFSSDTHGLVFVFRHTDGDLNAHEVVCLEQWCWF